MWELMRIESGMKLWRRRDAEGRWFYAATQTDDPYEPGHCSCCTTISQALSTERANQVDRDREKEENEVWDNELYPDE